MPSQVRSKATVEAILIAAAQILEREGPEGATTNAIAALAGVSIGSLYQYFDDREAIIEALASRHAEQLQTMLSRALGELMGKPLPEGIAGLMEAIIVVHRVNPGLDRALLQYGGLSEAGAVDDIEGFVAMMAAAALRLRPELGLADPERTARTLTSAVGGVVRATLRREPERLDEPAFKTELVDLVLGYLDRQSGT